MRLIRRASGAQLCLFAVAMIASVSAQDDSAFPSPPETSTSNPETFRTGKLNQFQGFFTPKPYPDNANFVYASIWASWSAWSFCSNNIQIRVRACNTVRGFTCPGANQERRACGESANRMNQFNVPGRPNPRRFGGDYDAVDPWEEDRKEALRQLYSDYTPSDDAPAREPAVPLLQSQRPRSPPKIHDENGREFSAVARSGGRTASGYGGNLPIGPPIEDYGRKFHSDGTGEAPSMTPELLFGSKLEIPTKRIKSKSNSIESKEGGANNGQELQGIDSASHSSEHTEAPEHQASQEAVEVGREVPTVDSTGSPLRVVPADAFTASPAATEEPITENTDSESPESHPDISNVQLPEEHQEVPSIDAIDLQPESPSTSEAPSVIAEDPKEASSLSSIVQPTPAPSVIESSDLEVIPEHESEQATGHARPQTVQPTKVLQTTNLDKLENHRVTITPPEPIDDGTEVRNSGELYDDEVEQKRKTANADVTPQPELKQHGGEVFDKEDREDIKAIEDDMAHLAQFEDILHSGEIVFNKDTANALEWLLANMTKAAAQAQNHLNAEAQKAKFFPGQETKGVNSVLDAEQEYKTSLHSGEVNFGTVENSGEFDGLIGVNKVVHRAHAAKTQQQLIEEKPVTIKGLLPSLKKTNGVNYQKAKVIKPAQFQLRPDIETIRLETELRRLQSDMQKMESDLAIIQTDNSDANRIRTTQRPYTTPLPIEIVTVPTPATTISNQKANEKAMDLELVPKAPPKNAYLGPLTTPALPSIINTENGELFVLDGPQKASTATWSEWREWADCFCDKQVRTRICNYDSAFHSKGCSGKSFESRSCVATRPCPAKLAAARRTSTASPIGANAGSDGLYTISPPRSRTGYAFRPNPLSRAISSIQFHA
uniref:Mucin-5AC n=1 Tax=Panagrellus redivivus TaxID=6233 RepID=A0A7E4VG91_PANRE